jgi:hypothetical protein
MQTKQGNTQIYDVPTGALVQTLGSNLTFRTVALSRLGDYLAVLDQKGNVWVWGVSDKRMYRHFPASTLSSGRPHTACVAFDDVSQTLFTAGSYGDCYPIGFDRWDLKTGKNLSAWNGPIGDATWLSWSSDKTKLLVGLGNRQINAIWSFEDHSGGRQVSTVLASSSFDDILGLSPDNELMAVYSGSSIVIRDAVSSADLFDTEVNRERFCGFLPNNRQFLIIKDEYFSIWDIAEKRCLKDIYSSRDVKNWHISLCGTALAAGYGCGRIDVISLPEGTLLCRLQAHNGGVTGLTFLDGRNWVASVATDRKMVLSSTCEGQHPKFQMAADGANWASIEGDSRYFCKGKPLFGFSNGTEVEWPLSASAEAEV